MTDKATHTHIDGTSITITRARADSERGRLFIATHAAGSTASTYLAVDRLLAMIDTIDPDAMRAYLRERSDYLDSPHEPHELPCVPEPDSPEDVDEQPDPVEQMRESGRQLGEAWRALTDAFKAASKGSDR